MISDRDVVTTAIISFARFLIAQGQDKDVVSKAVHDWGVAHNIVGDQEETRYLDDWVEHLYVYDYEAKLGHRLVAPEQLIQITDVQTSPFLGTKGLVM